MKVNWTDQSADGLLLEWRPHFLSTVMSYLNRLHLVEEPVAREPEGLGARLLEVVPTPEGLRWSPGSWARLKVELCTMDGFPGLTSARELHVAPGRWMLPWRELPPCDALDLTPYDSMGVAGVTTRVLRPPDQPWVPFDIRDVSEPRPGLRVVPIRREGLERLGEIAVLPLRQTGHDQFRPLRPVRLSAGHDFLPLPSGFEGLVAVYAKVGELCRLLDCRVVDARRGMDGHPRALAEWTAARRYVGSGDLEVSLWPDRSASRLKKILTEAGTLGFSLDFLAEHENVQGLHRLLVLTACGVAPSAAKKGWDLPGLAAYGDLRELLESLTSSALLAWLEEIKAPATRLWILRNAAQESIEEILEWASAAGPSGLEMARGLLHFRKTLQQLAAEVREETAEGREIARLLRQVEKAPSQLRRPKDLESRLAWLEERARLSREGQPPLDGEPPITKEQHTAWREARRRSWTWRAWVDAVLTYCETGRWMADPPAVGATAPRETTLDGLADRALALAEPVELPRRPGPETGKLSALLDEVFGYTDWEPDSAVKTAVLERLSSLVRPDPGRWAVLHTTIREALQVAERWPQLARELGGTGRRRRETLNELAERSALLLDVAAELRGAARSWPPALAPLAPENDPEILLASPGHPALESAYRQYAELAQRLDRAPVSLPVLTRAPGVSPPEAFRRWWREIESLFAEWLRLQREGLDFERKVRWARESLVPLAHEHLDRWPGRPAGDRPAALQELDDAVRAIEAADGAISRRLYTRFIDAFEKVEKQHGRR